ncbi:MotA/TolQ/ExbB proton channel family protein [Geminocystis sp.]|uniref:MotA/TolQ/ExbB proton channel family protein n=1 Tax=Geminocystis sp. TaxID=2664100 RepID=UPI003593C5D4
MLETFKIFPLWLTIITVVFVILPTILSGLTRRILYLHLQDLEKKTRRLVNGDNQGIQPRFINLLQQKFAKASQQIENVNTIALIDGVYHQETINFLNVNIRCEEAESITKTIPNLLLAFGLLGTFLGITLNLNSISQIINQGGADIADLTSKLQSPLQSMGIAFITSLIGLFCSSILTVINLKFNINLEKNSLLNNLEDYLDNIYKPLVEGDTRLDKAVNKMVDKQTEFLERFHEKVGQVLERTFKQAADKIADENEKSVRLVTQICNTLWEVSSTLNTGANTFQLSMDKLANQVKNLDNIVVKLDKNINNFENSSQLILKASNKIEASKFSENLEKITNNLAQTQEAFTASTKELTKGVIIFNKDSKKATDLALNIYEELKKASESLEESSVLFADSATTIKESQFSEKLMVATNNLMTIQQPFLDMINILNQAIQPLENNIKTFDASVNKMVEVTPNYEQFKYSIEILEESAVIFGQSAMMIKDSKFDENLVNTASNLATIQQQFLQIVNSLSGVIQPIENNLKTLDLSIDKMVKVTPDYQQFKSAIELLDKSANIFINSAIAIKETKFNEGLAQTTTNLAKIQQLFLQTIKSLNEVVKPINTNVQMLDISTNKMTQLAQNVNHIESNINTINDRYLEMTNTSRDILLKLGENTVKNNERYSEMTNISRDILLKLGESTVKNTNSYSELFKSLEKINKELEERLKLLEKNEKVILIFLQKIAENVDRKDNRGNKEKSDIFLDFETIFNEDFPNLFNK